MCPDHDPERQAAAGERGGGVVAPRTAGDGDQEQRLLVGEQALWECFLVAARLLAQPAVVFGGAVELEQEADRPLAGQQQLAVAVGGCLAGEGGQAAPLAPPLGEATADGACLVG